MKTVLTLCILAVLFWMLEGASRLAKQPRGRGVFAFLFGLTVISGLLAACLAVWGLLP